MTETAGRPTISAVFPMFNEREYLGKTVAIARETLEDITDDFEIIIVDDASTDGSGELADEMARSDGRIRVLHNMSNSRLGATLRAGFAAAGKDFIIYSDMDLPFDWVEMKKALRVMDLTGCDIVTAYRHDRTSEGWLRSIYSGAYNMLIRAVFGVRVRDINFSMKLFKREILRDIRLESSGSFVDAEFIIKARRAGYSLSQFGIDYFARTKGISTLSSPGTILNIIRELVLFRLRLLRRPGPPEKKTRDR